MPNNNYKNEKRYILALTSENFDNFLLKKAISDDCLRPNGCFCNVSDIINRVLNRISKENKEFLLNQVINRTTTYNETILNKFINWISKNSILLFTMKDIYMSNPMTLLELLKIYDIREEYLENHNSILNNSAETFAKIEDYKLTIDHSPYATNTYVNLLSIKESNIYNIYTQLGYSINYIREYISEKLKLEAVLKLYKRNRLRGLAIILKSPEHIFCLNPYPLEFLEDLSNNTIYNLLQTYQGIPVINHKIIDEVVVNDFILWNVDTKIKHLTKSDYLANRVSSHCNYFSPFVIPLGELLDMELDEKHTDY